jgi:hypothetical protein
MSINKKSFLDCSRKIRASLSFFFSTKEKSFSKNDLIIIKKIIKITKKINKIKKIKSKTHQIFSEKILNLITKKKLLNFLQINFIQHMFFIHNRFFLIKELIELYNDKDWFKWKEIIKEDNIGNPVRFFLYPYSSGNKIHQAYHLKKFTEISKINLKNFNNVIEFGGGYGNMAKMFNKINKKNTYTIFDTAEVNLLQYYYLKKSNLNVNLGMNKKFKINLINKLSDLKRKISSLKIREKNLFIANWSLSEVPLKFRDELFFIFKKIDYHLISYQDKFENIINNNYFNKINKYNRKKNRKSQIIKIKYKPNNYYLFSYR